MVQLSKDVPVAGTINDLSSTSPSVFDVIICGSGSAGLAAATWLSRYGIRSKILEQRDGPMEMGQADGVQCRTVEVFESFGLAEELLKQAYHVLEVTFWSSTDSTDLKRNRRTADTQPGLSHQPHVILNQALVNKMMIEAMKKTNGQTIDYGYKVKSVQIDQDRAADPGAHCVTVVAERDGQEEKFKSKYVLGCDGAHSAVRHSLGFKMVGDSTNNVWGVMDVYPRTDFPDIRKKVVIHSPAGTLVIIPREGQTLVRFYIELGHDTIAKNVKLDDLQATARRIFAPFKMDIAETYWWSAYSIGQRLADHFHQDYRVFLTGDACHTHSPKAGQGMNVSLQDGYNMGWKLGAVLTGQCHPDLLKTYVLERADVAAKLIQFDREWSRLFSSTSSRHQNAVTPEYFSEQFIKNGQYTAGLTAKYQPSLITSYALNTASSSNNILNGNPPSNPYARNLTVGMRLPSTQVVRHCDAKAMHLIRALPADTRWRILIFTGPIPPPSSSSPSISSSPSFLTTTTNALTTTTTTTSPSPSPSHHPSPYSALRKFSSHLATFLTTHPNSRPYIDSFIEPLLITSTPLADLSQSFIPDVFYPPTGRHSIRDLHKTFVDDESYNSGHGHAFDFYGVDPTVGAVVVVRPDHHVGLICGISDEGWEEVRRFFVGVCEGESGKEVRSEN